MHCHNILLKQKCIRGNHCGDHVYWACHLETSVPNFLMTLNHGQILLKDDGSTLCHALLLQAAQQSRSSPYWPSKEQKKNHGTKCRMAKGAWNRRLFFKNGKSALKTQMKGSWETHTLPCVCPRSSFRRCVSCCFTIFNVKPTSTSFHPGFSCHCIDSFVLTFHAQVHFCLIPCLVQNKSAFVLRRFWSEKKKWLFSVRLSAVLSVLGTLAMDSATFPSQRRSIFYCLALPHMACTSDLFWT